MNREEKYQGVISLSPLRITIVYLVVAALWVAFTDRLLNTLVTEPGYLSLLQTYKGWFYVLVTSLGLFLLIKAYQKQASRDRLKRKESENILQRTFESLNDSVILIDPVKRIIVNCNNAAVEMFGFAKKKLIGESTRLLHLDESKFREFRKLEKKTLSEERVFKTEFVLKRKDGSTIHSDHTVSYVYGDEGEVDMVVNIVRDVTERNKMEERIMRSAIAGEDRERKRIARELHDAVGQYLAASNMNFESVKRQVDSLSGKKNERFKKGLFLLKKAMYETRNIAHNLMPEELQDYGLELAVESLADSIEESAGVKVEREIDIDEAELEMQTATNIYRIIQEALSNAVKHGKCTSIRVTLTQKEKTLDCIIRDNGEGIPLDEQARSSGLGLRSMKARAKSLSGTIHFDSDPGEGMTITMHIPLLSDSEEMTYG